VETRWRVIPERTVTKPAMSVPVGPPLPQEPRTYTYRGAPPRAELEAAYALVPSIELLGKFYKVAAGTVQRWLLHYGIPRMPSGARTGKKAKTNLPALAELAKTFTRQPTGSAPLPPSAPATGGNGNNDDNDDAPTSPPAHPDINFDDDEYVYGELLSVDEQKELKKLHSHWPGCYTHGVQHYTCALAEIVRLHETIDAIQDLLTTRKAGAFGD
jgi:hypothetical protein